MIENYSFGRITVNGKTYTSDVLITGDTVLNWWRKEGHVLNPEDLTAIVQANPEVLIVGTGAYGVMKVPEKTVQFIKGHNITLIVEKTGKAVDTFNSMAGKKAAAFHLTC